MTKKDTAPLPLWFDSPKEMDQISNKKVPLMKVFDTFDNGHNRIDSTELFSVMMVMSKGDPNLKVACKDFIFE